MIFEQKTFMNKMIWNDFIELKTVKVLMWLLSVYEIKIVSRSKFNGADRIGRRLLREVCLHCAKTGSTHPLR